MIFPRIYRLTVLSTVFSIICGPEQAASVFNGYAQGRKVCVGLLPGNSPVMGNSLENERFIQKGPFRDMYIFGINALRGIAITGRSDT